MVCRADGWPSAAVCPRVCGIHKGTGLTAERQQFREGLPLQAAERFVQGDAGSAIVKDLRVSVRSVQHWGRRGRRAVRVLCGRKGRRRGRG